MTKNKIVGFGIIQVASAAGGKYKLKWPTETVSLGWRCCQQESTVNN
jgi:hypothetical protein